jgi:predicted nucleotidyltransferase
MPEEKLRQILRELREGLIQILGDHLVNVFLYGSRARGDARPDSDIDVLIVLNEDFDYGEVLSRTLDLTAALSLEYDVVISRAFVTRERFEHEMSPFLMNVRREAVPA